MSMLQKEHSLCLFSLLISLFLLPFCLTAAAATGEEGAARGAADGAAPVPGGAGSKAPAIAIVPRPLSVVPGEGSFRLGQETRIVVPAGDTDALKVACYLAARLVEEAPAPAGSGKLREVKAVPDSTPVRQPEGTILLASRKDAGSLGEEGYELVVMPRKITITAARPAGLFYGVQSLLQLLPLPGAVSTGAGAYTLPAVRIEDRPRFPWRGMHLDVSRHFMPVAFIKRYIDLLAMHKMNVFHWHLTDDQGWRIEIEKYPRLTEVGAWRREKDGRRYGGFYTQEEIRDVVAYAAERFVRVVPEIEMPGHSMAALAAYPEFSCRGGPFAVPAHWGVFPDVYCAGNDGTFTFLENILDEVIALFPGEYVHIGGDECPKTRWKACPKCQARIKAEGLAGEHELQSWFIRRIEKFLGSRGRKLIGWDEILEGGLAENAAVMSWRGMGPGAEAARMGHDVVMSPTSHCYFDYRQSDAPGEPGAFAVIPLEKVYAFEPVPPGLDPAAARHIIGGQGNVWTEHMETERGVEFMILPRMSALAEVLWSASELRNFKDFARRLIPLLDRFAAEGLNCRVPMPRGFGGLNFFTDAVSVTIESPLPGAAIRYTLDGTEPCPGSPLVKGTLGIDHNALLKARLFLPQGLSSRTLKGVFEKAVPEPAVEAGPVDPGLSFAYFEGRFDTMPDFRKIEPVKKGIADLLRLPEGCRRDGFALEFTGFIKIPAGGIYAFSLTSDDGSALFIDGSLVVDNGGLHARQAREGQAALAAGFHPMRVVFFEAGGAEALEARWKGPGFVWTGIPAKVLFHEK